MPAFELAKPYRALRHRTSNQAADHTARKPSLGRGVRSTNARVVWYPSNAPVPSFYVAVVTQQDDNIARRANEIAGCFEAVQMTHAQGFPRCGTLWVGEIHRVRRG
jgi:hypothetical protein